VALLAALAGGASAQMVFGGRRFVTQQQQQTSGPPGSLSGHVVNGVTGEPVRGATVNLLNYSRGGNSQPVTTDAAGAFAAANLPPGDYYVQATHPGYQGLLGLPNPSQVVTVASSGNSSEVTLRLMPGGTISGKVLDDGGEPMPGCSLWALSPADGASPWAYAQKGGTSTNDKGEYKFDALAADRYLVHIRCQESLPVERRLAAWRPEQIEPAESWMPAFYPDSLSPQGAQWLTVLPGSSVTGIDFHLKATPVTTVSGALGGLASTGPGSQPNVQLYPGDAYTDPSLAYGAAFDAATSTFKFLMVPPGSYRLAVVSSGMQAETLAYASLPVTVGPVRPAPLSVQMHQGLNVSGVLELPPAAGGAGTPALPDALQTPGQPAATMPGLGFISLFPVSPGPFSNARQAQVRHDGTFTVPALMPGRYRVIMSVSSPQPSAVESVQFGPSQSARGVFDLAEGASGSLRVRMGAAPQVSANLAGAPAGTGGQWLVYGLPVDEPALPFNQFTGGPGKGGDTVLMQNAAAGRFVFVAIEPAMNGAMNNQRLIQLLREHAEPVEISTGQSQTVSPKFFSSQEIEKLALAYLRGEAR